jgi:hypothetical protein
VGRYKERREILKVCYLSPSRGTQKPLATELAHRGRNLFSVIEVIVQKTLADEPVRAEKVFGAAAFGPVRQRLADPKNRPDQHQNSAVEGVCALRRKSVDFAWTRFRCRIRKHPPSRPFIPRIDNKCGEVWRIINSGGSRLCGLAVGRQQDCVDLEGNRRPDCQRANKGGLWKPAHRNLREGTRWNRAIIIVYAGWICLLNEPASSVK